MDTHHTSWSNQNHHMINNNTIKIYSKKQMDTHHTSRSNQIHHMINNNMDTHHTSWSDELASPKVCATVASRVRILDRRYMFFFQVYICALVFVFVLT